MIETLILNASVRASQDKAGQLGPSDSFSLGGGTRITGCDMILRDVRELDSATLAHDVSIGAAQTDPLCASRTLGTAKLVYVRNRGTDGDLLLSGDLIDKISGVVASGSCFAIVRVPADGVFCWHSPTGLAVDASDTLSFTIADGDELTYEYVVAGVD